MMEPERSFPRRLFEVVESSRRPEVVSWCLDGEAFVVRDLPRFCEEVLPLHFEEGTTKWDFFEQQLQLHGFERVSQTFAHREGSVFRHPCFQKGQRQLLDGFFTAESSSSSGALAVEVKGTTDTTTTTARGVVQEQPQSQPMRFLCCWSAADGVRASAVADLMAAAFLFLVGSPLLLPLLLASVGACGLRAATSVWHAKVFYYAKCAECFLSLFVTPTTSVFPFLNALFKAGFLCFYTLYCLLLARAHLHTLEQPQLATVAAIVDGHAPASLNAPLLVVVN